MELEILELIMIVLISGVAVLAAIFILRKQYILLKRRQELYAKLKVMGGTSKLKFYKIEYFSDRLLALDQFSKRVFYLDYFNSDNNRAIKLEDLMECKLLTKRLVVQLELIYQNPCTKACSVVFYQKYIDPDVLRYSLTTKARRWTRVLSEAIAKNKIYEYGITG